MANNNIGRRISYRKGSNGNKPEEKPSGFDPFYGGEGENLIPFPRDRITPWHEDETKKREGIMSQLVQMSNRELREFYGGYLVPYGYKEDQIMRMPIKELELLFNKVMRI